jgi:lipoyl(octanoyl) transferase
MHQPALDKGDSNHQQFYGMEHSMTQNVDSLDWRRDSALVPYRAATAEQEARNAAIAAGDARELVWLLEHPPVYTAGTSAATAELLDPRFEVVETGRGGRYTYHGPGQRVGYVLLDLSRRGRDVRRFVHALEGWVIATLAGFGVEAWAVPERIGIWTRDIDGSEAKIGAIGVRVRKWVTMHGFAVNLAPDLSHFSGIVPCGVADFGVTSLARLGLAVGAEEWDGALRAAAGDFLAALEAPE